MKQMLTVTYHNDEVFALDLQAELPKSLKLEASSGDKQMLFQFSGARYSLDATAPGNLSYLLWERFPEFEIYHFF